MSRSLVRFALVFALFLVDRCADASIALVDTISVSAQFGGGSHGIDFNREFNEVYLVTNNLIQVYDLEFNFKRTIPITSVGSRQGIHRDVVTGDFFVTNHIGSIDRFNSVGGFISTFSLGPSSAGNGMAYNASTGNIWVASFNGGVKEFDLNGNLISSFLPGGTSSPVGIAYDPVNDALLIGENDNNKVREYTTTGAFLGDFLPAGAVPFNGLGMDYDSVTGNFYYAGASPGRIDVFNDPARLIDGAVPEPFSLLVWGSLIVATGVAVPCRRHVRG